jgi:hypothetical protein
MGFIEIWCLILICSTLSVLIFDLFSDMLLQKLESEVLEFELLFEWAG